MRVLYVIACGAGPAPHVGRLIDQARQRRWDVHLIATPAAMSFFDIGALEAQTGHAVRSEHRRASTGSARSLPHADAIVVAPATYNTINKWAMGVSDNYALDILAESVGLAIPTVVLPFVNAALAAHPAFEHSVAVLRDARVAVLLGQGDFKPHPPGTGADHLDSFPWHHALDRAEALTTPNEAWSSGRGSPPHSAQRADV